MECVNACLLMIHAQAENAEAQQMNAEIQRTADHASHLKPAMQGNVNCHVHIVREKHVEILMDAEEDVLFSLMILTAAVSSEKMQCMNIARMIPVEGRSEIAYLVAI